MKTREALKTTLMVLLLFSAVALLYVNAGFIQTGGSVIRRPGAFEEPPASLTDALSGSSREGVITTPFAAAVGRKGALYGAMGDQQAVLGLYERVRTTLGEAVGSASGMRQASEGELITALSGDMIFIGFDSRLPLYLFSAWQGMEPSAELLTAGTVSSMVLAKSDENLVLFFRDQDTGLPVRCETQARAGVIDTLIQETAENGAMFAAHDMEQYGHLLPETLLPGGDVRTELLQYTADSPDLDAGTEISSAVLTAFQFNPFTVRRYEEADGTQVYVEDLATIRITPSGRLSFDIPDGHEGVPLAGYAQAQSVWERELVIIEQSRKLVESLYEGMGAVSAYTRQLYYDADRGVYYVTFGGQLSGVPVHSADGMPLVSVTVENGHVTEAAALLRRYTPGEAYTVLLPAKQAAAAVSKEGAILSLRYEDDGQTARIDAGWYAG